MLISFPPLPFFIVLYVIIVFVFSFPFSGLKLGSGGTGGKHEQGCQQEEQ